MLEGLNIMGIEAGPPVVSSVWSPPAPGVAKEPGAGSWRLKGAAAPGLNIAGGAPGMPGVAGAGDTGGTPLGTRPGPLLTGLLIPD